MKFVIGAIIVIGLGLGVWQIYQYWGRFKQPEAQTQNTAVSIPGDQLPGLPNSLQQPLQQAEQHGADGLGEFLSEYSSQIKDPRLASIQLDYVVLEGPTDPAQARLMLQKVQNRIQSDSPVYPRLQQLEKTYAQ